MNNELESLVIEFFDALYETTDEDDTSAITSWTDETPHEGMRPEAVRLYKALVALQQSVGWKFS